jgi:hypothetical protein
VPSVTVVVSVYTCVAPFGIVPSRARCARGRRSSRL